MAGIYLMVNTVTGTSYVGSSVDVDRRRRQHLSALSCLRHGNAHLQNSWLKYGQQAFVWIVLERVAFASALAEREQHWLRVFMQAGRVYNVGPVAANPNMGRKLTEEHRRKLSVAKLGKKLTPEHCRKMGLANTGITRNRGRVYTVDERAALSRALTGNKNSLGYKQSEETKRKRVEAANRTRAARKGAVAA